MLFLQIQNVDSFKKVIIDSLVAAQKQQFNSLDYINKVDSFYNAAWTKLAAVLGLVGVLVPLIINYVQLRKNEKEKDAIKDIVKAELTQEIDEYLESQLVRIQHASEGVSYHILSDIFFDKGKYKESFGETVNAMTCYLLGEDYTNFINAMEDMFIRIKRIVKEDLDSIPELYGEYYDVNSLIQKMEATEDQKYTCLVVKMKTAVKELG